MNFDIPVRILIDGPRKSGKSTLLFGYSHRDDIRASTPSLQSRGHWCFPEATEQAHRELRIQGIDGKSNREALKKRAAEIAKGYYGCAIEPRLYFFDRGIDAVYSQVFLCAPFASIDEEGRDSLENRLSVLQTLEEAYAAKGYVPIVVGVFDEVDRARNNALRIEFIESYLRV